MSQHVIKLRIKNGYKYVTVPDEYFLTLNRTTIPRKQSPLLEKENTSRNPSAPSFPPSPTLSDSQNTSCEKTVQGAPCFFSPKEHFLEQLSTSDLPEQFFLKINNDFYKVLKR